MADNFYKLFESSTPKTINNKLIQVTAASKPAPRKKEYAKAAPVIKPVFTQVPVKKVIAPATVAAPIVKVNPNEVSYISKYKPTETVTPTTIVNTPTVKSAPKMSDLEYMQKIVNSKVHAGKTGEQLADAGIISKANIGNYNKLVAPVDAETVVPEKNNGLAVAVTTTPKKDVNEVLTNARMQAIAEDMTGGWNGEQELPSMKQRANYANFLADRGVDATTIHKAVTPQVNEGLASSVVAPKVVYTNPNVSEKAQAQFAKDMADTAGMNAFDREVWLLQNRNR